MREFELIEKFFKPLTNSNKFSRDLADDAAKISLKKDEELVISKDMFVENVHFLLRNGGFKIASKLLRTNLSDLAASGATPLCYMLGFSKNERLNQKFFSEFARGLKKTQDEFGLFLLGGDTVSSTEVFFSITIFGVTKKGQILARKNAKDGDLVFVSGSIGDAGIGLWQDQQKNQQQDFSQKNNYLLSRHFFPTPRIMLGKMLLQKKLSDCAIDISDGLLAELRHLCCESKLDVEVFLNQIPFSSAAKKFLKKNPQKNYYDLLSSGDDYELIFSVREKNKKKVLELAKYLKLDLTCIGRFKKSSNKKFEVLLYEKYFDQKHNSSSIKILPIKIKKFGYEH